MGHTGCGRARRGVVGWGAFRVEQRYRTKRAKVPELNAYLSTAEPVERAVVARDPDAIDVELLRWCYAIANQPDDGLVGLDWGEQFHGGTQLRYQLNALCWSLSLYAANFVPNAAGPDRATRCAKLVEKHTDLRVWKYWRTLNLLGNFDANPDPIVPRQHHVLGVPRRRDQHLRGGDRLGPLRPARLADVRVEGRADLRVRPPLDRRRGASATSSAASSGSSRASPAGRSRCATSMGAQALHGHDTLHGTEQLGARPSRAGCRRSTRSTSRPTATYAHIRSNHVGLSWDTGEVPGGHYFANGTNRFADILPDHARRAEALERRKAEQQGARPRGQGGGRPARPRAADDARPSPRPTQRARVVERRHRRRPTRRRARARRRGDRCIGSAVRHRSALAGAPARRRRPGASAAT